MFANPTIHAGTPRRGAQRDEEIEASNTARTQGASRSARRVLSTICIAVAFVFGACSSGGGVIQVDEDVSVLDDAAETDADIFVPDPDRDADIDATEEVDEPDVEPDASDPDAVDAHTDPDAADASDTHDVDDATDTSNGDTSDDTTDADAVDDTSPPADLILNEAYVQWTRSGSYVSVAGTGEDLEGADVDTLILAFRDADDATFAVDVEIDLDDVFYDATTFVFSVRYDLGHVTEALEASVAVRDEAGNESDLINATVLAVGETGDTCVAGGDPLSHCDDGLWCDAAAHDVVSVCVEVPGSAPVISLGSWISVDLDSDACAEHDGFLSTVEVAGTNDQPLEAITISRGDSSPVVTRLDDMDGPVFLVDVDLCLSRGGLDQALEVVVVDIAGRHSNTYSLDYPTADAGDACTPELLGMCGHGLYCEPTALTCQPTPEEHGVSCANPTMIGENVTRLLDTTWVDSFEGSGCLLADVSTRGRDRLYAVDVEPGETLSVVVVPLDGSSLSVFLMDTCQRAPSSACLAGASGSDDEEITLVHTNLTDGAQRLYVVVDEAIAPDDISPDPAEFQITIARAQSAQICPSDFACEVDEDGRKINLLFIVDYSTSMNEGYLLGTRWTYMIDGLIAMLNADDGLLARYANISVLRFGHDPAPSSTGTPIVGETTGLIDGHAVDVFWFDPADGEHTFRACIGDVVEAFLSEIPPPMGGSLFGIGTWTKGAMDRAVLLVEESRTQDLPGSTRPYVVVVVTDGAWTSQNGISQGSPPTDNPAITAAALLSQGVQTYVIEISGDAAAAAAADELAAAGGTTEAFSDFLEAATAIGALCR